jgi:cytidine deaminase
MTISMQELIAQAIQATENAYIPYSNYPVGAALLCDDGQIYTGCNIENASYPAGICAERTALAKAISEGSQTFSTIVIATRGGGSPCGICRQALYEFAPDLRVILVDLNGNIHHDTTLNVLLPLGFNHDNLK